MELNSPTFLFIFLPIFFVLYAVCGKRYRNILLILSSLIFFIWGDPLYFPVSLILVLLDWLFLQGIQKNASNLSRQKHWQTAGIVINLLCLLFFKVLASYGQPLAALAQHSGLAVPAWLTNNLPRIAHLPLGLSFLTFQAISLLLDAPYETGDQEGLFQPVALHLLMFPKAISGPLVRFDRIRSQTREREFTPAQIAAGLRRFMLGFAKKALIADQLALVTDGGIFAQAPQRIPAAVAWIVIVCYTLQIYFDFSAYTDMAIGLGQVLGFRLPENFNDPYWSVSITDFWRRWHMTLSGWFRDYVFYPLEMKRASSGRQTQSLNILIVFLLTGLWHGITPPFIVWGLLQGSAIALEHGPFGRWLRGLWRPLQHVYALLVIMLGWVFFRSPSLNFALRFLRTLIDFTHSAKPLPYSTFPTVPTLTWLAMAAGIILSLPLKRILPEKITRNETAWAWVQNILILVLFTVGIIVQAGTNYQPFIYGDF